MIAKFEAGGVVAGVAGVAGVVRDDREVEVGGVFVQHVETGGMQRVEVQMRFAGRL